MRAIACILVFAIRCLAAQAATNEVNWASIQPELIAQFASLLKINTTNPPGNETAAARFIQAFLEREGIPSRLFAAEPARANLVARIKGAGSKRPLLIMGHTDVVPVQWHKWSLEPFGGVRKGEWIYGRGAVDDKSHVVACMMAMALLKRQNVKLDRDVIFLAEAGEEGSPSIGIDYMIREHWDEIEAEYALLEGGVAAEERGRVRHVLIATTEKIPFGVRLVARGSAGHGSRPSLDNPIVRLAQAVARVSAWRTPARLNQTTRAYFERLAAISPGQAGRYYRTILNPALAPEADAYFRRRETGHYSMLRTSVVPTIIRGGFSANVIPSEAEAHLDVRALPDEDMTKFLAELRRVIGDTRVEVALARTETRPGAPPSRIDNEMFRALETVSRRVFDAPTLPTMLTGATDAAQLRAKGVQAYGYGPPMRPEGPTGGPHGDDERISVDSLEKLLQFLWYTLMETAASPTD